MKSIQLYRLLQEHAAIINNLAARLYNSEIEVAEAISKALPETKHIFGILEKEDAQL